MFKSKDDVLSKIGDTVVSPVKNQTLPQESTKDLVDMGQITKTSILVSAGTTLAAIAALVVVVLNAQKGRV